MAKADRLERLDARRAELETDYTEALVAALRDTARGQWGLFDHNQDRRIRAKVAPVVDTLNELGAEIDVMRTQLTMPHFDLHHDFLAARGPVASNRPGEPKQALAWLERLGVATA